MRLKSQNEASGKESHYYGIITTAPSVRIFNTHESTRKDADELSEDTMRENFWYSTTRFPGLSELHLKSSDARENTKYGKIEILISYIFCNLSVSRSIISHMSDKNLRDCQTNHPQIAENTEYLACLTHPLSTVRSEVVTLFIG